MLLKRRRDQSVTIGPDVTVKVLKIHNGAVTLQIEAPASYRISRSTGSPDTEESVAATDPAVVR